MMARRLRRLPADEREVIELVYVGGHSCTSSADVLGRPRELVAEQIGRGIAGLRAQRAGDDSWDDLLTADVIRTRDDGQPWS
jgi:DNA-directed RNA polymerase specialized sigma24 family protein